MNEDESKGGPSSLLSDHTTPSSFGVGWKGYEEYGMIRFSVGRRAAGGKPIPSNPCP